MGHQGRGAALTAERQASTAEAPAVTGAATPEASDRPQTVESPLEVDSPQTAESPLAVDSAAGRPAGGASMARSSEVTAT
jgi:hypothetical protein